MGEEMVEKERKRWTKKRERDGKSRKDREKNPG